jgi:hypothetical protein
VTSRRGQVARLSCASSALKKSRNCVIRFIVTLKMAYKFCFVASRTAQIEKTYRILAANKKRKVKTCRRRRSDCCKSNMLWMSALDSTELVCFPVLWA